MNNKTLSILSVVLGIVFVAIAIVYWTTPAGSLPTFMPGYIAGATGLHTKHAIASILLAIILFIFAWFKSAKKVPANTDGTRAQ